MKNRIKWVYHSAWSKYHWWMADSVNLEEDWFGAYEHHAKRANYHDRKAVSAEWGM